MSEQVFDYINGLMDQARKGRVIERTTRVQIKRLDPSEWKRKAFNELKEWLAESKDHTKTIDLWAAVYIRCGSCARGFQDWVKDNPYSEGWTERAIETIEKNRWV